MIPITIDGRADWVEDGATILRAASGLKIAVPTLCYHPNLKPQGICRICLVEVEVDGDRRLRTACNTTVIAGMRIWTESASAVGARRFALELILADHPLDCLTCEAAGACELQDLAYRHGFQAGRFDGERERYPLDASHPFILVDRNKCIHCRRCIQACGEIQGQFVWGIAGRGDRSKLIADLDKALGESSCVSCGQCVAYCPTGALIEKLPLGQGRSWEMRKVATTCPYCGCGCALDLNVKDGQVVKVTSNFEGPANQGSLCVKGRFGYEFLSSADRLKQPLIRKGDRFVPTSWEEALTFVAKRLLEIKQRHGPDAVGVWSSAKATNEENYLIQKLARAALGTNNVDHCARLCHAPTATGLTFAFGSAAATNSFDDLEEAKALLVIGSNTTEQHPIAALPMKRLARHGVPLIVVDPRKTELARLATVHLQLRPGTDLPLLNGMAHVILKEGLWDQEFVFTRTEGFEAWAASVEGYPPEEAAAVAGVPVEDLKRAARIYATRKPAALFYTMGITQHIVGHRNVLAIANLALLTGNVGRPGAGVNPLRGQNNVQGSCDMGALPNLLPGYQRIDDEGVRTRFEAAWGVPLPKRPGLTLTQMVEAAGEGGIRALYIVGENGLLTEPDLTHTEACLRRLEFFVVQDLFLSETARLAHVVLPAAAFAEKDGTFTNTERRIQRVRKAVEPSGEAKADWEIVCRLSALLGYPMAYASPAEVMEEIARLTPIYGGVSYARLERTSLQWPCPDPEHPGTPILHAEGFMRSGGKGRFSPVEHVSPDEVPDEAYPFVLTTGRSLYHFHTGTMTRRSPGLNALRPEAWVELSSDDAGRLGIAAGERVRVSSRRGALLARAQVVDGMLPGLLFLTFHYAESPANLLTNPAVDPVAFIPEYKVCAARVERDGTGRRKGAHAGSRMSGHGGPHTEVGGE